MVPRLSTIAYSKVIPGIGLMPLLGEADRSDLNPDYTVLVITATGRGSRQMLDGQNGFPRSKPKAVKRVHRLQTGDMVKVVIEKGKYQGVYIGRAVVKGSGYFDVATSSGKKISTSWKRFRLLQRFDGYAYDCRRTTTSVRLK